MSYETQPSPRNGVSKNYGVVDILQSAGTEHTKTSTRTAKVMVTGDTASGGFLPPLTLPVGAYITRVLAEVTEAFVLGGTAPTIRVRDSGTVADFCEITEAQAEAVGTYDITASLAGDWDSTGNGIDTLTGNLETFLGGSSPTITTVGKVVFLIEYVNAA